MQGILYKAEKRDQYYLQLEQITTVLIR